MGVRVGGHHPANFSYRSKDAQENSPSFDTNLMGSVGRREKLCAQNRLKINLTGVEIACVEVKSNKDVDLISQWKCSSVQIVRGALSVEFGQLGPTRKSG